MMIHIRAIGMASSPSLHDYAERRAFGAIGRIASPLDRVAISISDDNGPRGGVDKRCRIVLSGDRKSTRLNSSHEFVSRMPSSA